jgi:hypothetical protein
MVNQARTLCLFSVDGGELWNVFTRPIKHHAVAKRQAFEAIAWASKPLATVQEA